MESIADFFPRFLVESYGQHSGDRRIDIFLRQVLAAGQRNHRSPPLPDQTFHQIQLRWCERTRSDIAQNHQVVLKHLRFALRETAEVLGAGSGQFLVALGIDKLHLDAGIALQHRSNVAILPSR